MPKVAIQKGEINPNPKTMKQMTHTQNLIQASYNRDMIKEGQTLTFMTPKVK